MTMAEHNLDKAIAYLGSSLQTLVQQANGPVDLDNLHTRILKRSLTGDHLMGGTIVNFASTGIKDQATSQQLTIKDSGIEINNLTVGAVKGNLSVENTITANTIKVDVLEVRELKTDLKLGQSAPLEITVTGGDTLVGKGMLLKGQGSTKQLIFSINPDKFVSTEHFELIKDRENGLLIDPSSTQQIADAISELLSNPGLAQQLGNRAKAKAEELFDPYRQSQKLAEVYDEIFAEIDHK